MPSPSFRIPFVDLARDEREVFPSILEAVRGVAESHRFILGPEVERFEAAFARTAGAAHGIGTSSGLDALRLALAACGVGPGDEVILPANTFIATALAVSALGAVPVLVDCGEDAQLDPAALTAAATPRTRAILPVHLYGTPCDLDAILAFARPRGIRVVEDACQAHGARLGGRPVGALADAGCFSFYPAKNLGAWGDAGFVATNDAEIARRVRLLRHYGQEVRYRHVVRGLNARLDTLQAGVLLAKLPMLEGWNAARKRLAARYREGLRGSAAVPIPEPPGRDGVVHLFVVRVPDRDAVARRMGERGVETLIHYPVPIHLQPAYRDLGVPAGRFPVTERMAGEILSLPMFPSLTDGEVDDVIKTLREAIG